MPSAFADDRYLFASTAPYLAHGRAGLAGIGLEHGDAILDWRVVFANLAPPLTDAAQSPIGMPVRALVQAHEQEAGHAAQQDLELQESLIALHPVGDLEQGSGQGAWIASPLSSQGIGSVFPRAADKECDKFCKKAHHPEEQHGDDEATDTGHWSGKALFAVLAFEIESALGRLDKGRSKEPWQTAGL